MLPPESWQFNVKTRLRRLTAKTWFRPRPRVWQRFNFQIECCQNALAIVRTTARRGQSPLPHSRRSSKLNSKLKDASLV